MIFILAALTLAAVVAALTAAMQNSDPIVYSSRYVTMRDGVKIAVDLYLPRNLKADQRLPAILEQTRYYRAFDIVPPFNRFAGGIDPSIKRFVENGYAYVQYGEMVMTYNLPLIATLAQFRYLLVLLLILTYAITTGAEKHTHSRSQTTVSKTQFPTVQQILDKYVQSIGGKIALEKLSSRIMKGSYAIPTKGYITPVEMLWKAPDKFKLAFTGKRNTAARGVDGNTGWSRDWSEEGLREINGPELIADQREVDFYREIKLKELYPQMTLKGLEKVNDKDVYAIDAVSSEGTHETMYFEIDSGLLVRRDLKLFLSVANVQLNLMNYKEVDGIKLPFTIQLVRSDKPFMNIFSFDVALLNPKIDDRQFAKPAVK